ncbi:DNA-directed RNA polymerase [Dactylonectria macrodidyma]|uniref:DNA-directed RNA polymerase n=1 Tax=Dactylonectria macrodidyma TaxID=307937 RepID=A0A9P9FPQ2_9HYPO|nr:DNA-directed RNA polymerase [Dactylonectria macrodidyma]
MPVRTKKTEDPVEDANMEDAPPSAQPEAVNDEDVEEEEEEEEDIEPQRVKILPGSTDTAASFEFIDEGHTLGNALRYIVMKKYALTEAFETRRRLMIPSPDVEFCAYSIPHPSETKMNIRIQTYKGTAFDALKKGLSDLQDVCDVVADEYWTKRQAYNSEHGIDR